MSVITARFSSTCQPCGGRIKAGDRINYVRGMAATHEACGQPTVTTSRRMTRISPGRYAWTSSGARMTSRRGRCEDAPCCGCCD